MNQNVTLFICNLVMPSSAVFVIIYNDMGQKTEVSLITGIDISTNEIIEMDLSQNQMYNCHGFSSLDGQFLVHSSMTHSEPLLMDKLGKSHGNGELKGLVNYDFGKIKKGDIIVYFNKDGVPVHSAVFAGENSSDDKVNSKNGTTPIAQYKEKEVFETYSHLPDPAVTRGFFTPQADKKVTFNIGEVDENRGIRQVAESNVKSTLHPGAIQSGTSEAVSKAKSGD